jgi:hypothetical protein
MFKDKQHTMKLSAVERDIDAAIKRVHETYGTDLFAFFKNVQRDATGAQLQQESANAPQKPSPPPVGATKKRLKS